MRIETDDELYRVDSVWLGPEKATVPWRARYVDWGVGLALFLGAFTVVRNILGISFSIFAIGWSLVIAIVLTRAIAKRITHERPLREVLRMARHELTTPRPVTTPVSGATAITAIRIRPTRPRAPRNQPGRTHSQEADRA